MKREIPLAAMVAIVLTVVVVIGLLGWNLMSPSGPGVSKTTAQVKKNTKDGGD